MKFLVVFLNVFLLMIPDISIATTPATQKHITGDAEAIPSQEECRHLVETIFENDNWSFTENGNDDGYTHGHQIRITRLCDSGVETSIIVDSRFFTDSRITYISREGDIRVRSRFEESNSVAIEHIWKDPNEEMYKKAGLKIGQVSRKRRRWAGKQHEFFHDSLSFLFEKRYADAKTGDTATGIFEHEYRQQDKEIPFGGVYFALGNSYPLNGLKKTCSKQYDTCFHLEIGGELSSLEHGSNVFASSEMEVPTIWDALSVVISIKVQKNESIDGITSERALGLKVKLPHGLQLDYLVKERHLPNDWTQYSEYDNDKDPVARISLKIPFPE